MKKGSLSYEAIQSMLLEKMQERGCSTVSVTLCRYVSNSIFRMMKDRGYKEYCKEGASKALNAYLNQNGANQYYSSLKTTIHRMDDLLDGTWKERHGPGRRQFSLTRNQADVIEDYCSFCESAGRKPGTIAIKKYATSWFLYVKLRILATNEASQSALIGSVRSIPLHSVPSGERNGSR